MSAGDCNELASSLVFAVDVEEGATIAQRCLDFHDVIIIGAE